VRNARFAMAVKPALSANWKNFVSHPKERCALIISDTHELASNG
jgi:hypothetical protein